MPPDPESESGLRSLFHRPRDRVASLAHYEKKGIERKDCARWC